MPTEKARVMAKIAAGGDNGIFAFMQMAKRFFDRDGEMGLNTFVESAFSTMPHADQRATVVAMLVAVFDTDKKHLH